MRLTLKEKHICDEHRVVATGAKAHCNDCPLVINEKEVLCYALIDPKCDEVIEKRRYHYEECRDCAYYREGFCKTQGSGQSYVRRAPEHSCEYWTPEAPRFAPELRC